MSKKNKRAQAPIQEPSINEHAKDIMPQHEAPANSWPNFEACWHASVNNGNPLLLQSCKAHLKALGWLNKPEKWIEGILHFGVEVEK